MKILLINTVFKQGSTGNIAYQIQQKAIGIGYNCIVAYRYAESSGKLPDSYEISTWLDCHAHNRLARITGLQGMFSRLRTKKFIRYIRSYNPDIIHLHNIHGSYIHHGELFSFLQESGIPLVWTLHDCWAFTGGCPHFTMIKCDNWKTGCRKCPQIIKNTKLMWKYKRKLFSQAKNTTVVAPSKWLAGLIGASYFKNHPVKVINNGISLSVFKPTPSDFRLKYGLSEKYILLGVAYVWANQKGLDVFIELSKRLESDKYAVVLVGTNDAVDKGLPGNIISIHRIYSQRELSEIYTAADVFINPTKEEVFGLVNAEALACGTPVLTFRTGGSPEVIDKTCGFAVDSGDIDALEREAVRICAEKPYTPEACIKRAERFDMNDKYDEYLRLYREITGK